MNVLEKILEEIEEATFQEDAPIYVGDMEVDGYVRASRVKEIIRSHMDEVENNGWIPVEERLPEAEGKPFYDMQLVTIEDGEVCLGVYHNEEKEWWTRRNEGEKRYTNKHDVVAWQPLPEPYKPNAREETASEHIMNRFIKVE